MMKLQQEQGFNPLAGCLPMLLQIPIFISLFHVLRHISNSAGICHPLDAGNAHLTLYTFSQTETCDAANAKLFGGAPLAGSLRDSASIIHALGGDLSTTRAVTLALVVISSAATFFTQLLVTSRATTVPTGTAATVQKLMKVFIPISVLVSGVLFPLGVLLYWFTSNVWTMLQQVYINKYHPPETKEVPETGALGKTLAPKPGQRPTREARGRTSLVKQSGAESADDEAPVDDSPAAAPPRNAAPRPGQRPQRQGGNRPPGKRPSQAKKRR
jgi:YidC/Oxa1 family membrane protein insertase